MAKPVGNERHHFEGRSEIQICQAPSTRAGHQFGEGLIPADEGVDGGPDPAVSDADDQDAGAPSEQRPPLQPEGQTQGVPEARRCRRAGPAAALTSPAPGRAGTVRAAAATTRSTVTTTNSSKGHHRSSANGRAF